MKGIIGHGAYLPRWRLERGSIGATLGTGAGKGRRSVASYDEDTTTMAVEAARLALRSAPGASPSSLWFSTTTPAYLDKMNATTIHAALRLDRHVLAADAGGAVRSGVAVLRSALEGSSSALVVAADIRGGLAGGPDESAGGDGAAALFVGSENDGPVVAEYLGSAGATEEFLDRWRAPGDTASKVWEERYGEGRYLELGQSAWKDGLKAAGIAPEEVADLVIASLHGRAVRALSRGLAASTTNVVPTLDVVATDGELLLVMDYVHGESLAQCMRAASAARSCAPRQYGGAVTAASSPITSWRGASPWRTSWGWASLTRLI